MLNGFSYIVLDMYDIDGINISDINPDRACLNCRHWQTAVQLTGPANGVICRLSGNHTEPNDTCGQFSPSSTFDSLQDTNRYHDKRHKMSVYRRL